MSTLRVDNLSARSGNTISVPSGTSLYVPGHVIQYVEYNKPLSGDNYTVISNGTLYDIPASVSITPKSTNSRLVIHAECQIRIQEADGLYSGIKRDGTALTGGVNGNALWFFYKNTLDNHHVQCQVNHSVIANSTSSTSFNQWITPYNGSGEYNQGWGLSLIQIWEIAQ